MVCAIDKMTPYLGLEGYKFTVLTDHQSLRCVQLVKNNP